MSSGTPDEIPPAKDPPVKNTNESTAKKSLFQEQSPRSGSGIQTPHPPGFTPSDTQHQAPNLSSGALPAHMIFPPPTGGQDGGTELVKALMAQIQLDRQEAKERERRDEARMAALERALLQANANTQLGNNVTPRRTERRTPLADNSRDPPGTEDLALPSNEEYYEDDDCSYHSSQDLTYYPAAAPTDDRTYDMDGAATNSSQAERAIRRSARDQIAQNQGPIAQNPALVQQTLQAPPIVVNQLDELRDQLRREIDERLTRQRTTTAEETIQMMSDRSAQSLISQCSAKPSSPTRIGKTIDDLFCIKQGVSESLEAFTKRFSDACLETNDVTDKEAIRAYMEGVRHEKLFYDLHRQKSKRLKQLFDEAKIYIQAEKQMKLKNAPFRAGGQEPSDERPRDRQRSRSPQRRSTFIQRRDKGK
ncbi:hypothetical protein COLO4_16783 [Corchorus olitorius]|uniref:Retrotransposon gag protein n=1 Tax=Corchorus olitorius TaxID=93759 RepID=A0A1R3JFM1_9ROSI|nr:hypothetical protein COLO4_16783 [Corchorus olitorius]